MAINIPSTSAPDYYISITAPQAVGYALSLTHYLSLAYSSRWAAIGIGSRMPHSLMFVIAQYNGNITLSVRLSEYTSTAHAEGRFANKVQGL